MRKLLIATLSFVGFVANADAAFISFVTGGARGHQFVLSDGSTRVAAGQNVRVGYLTTPGDSSTFVEFGTTTVANPLSSALIGGFVNTATGNNPSDAIKNRQVHVWVYGQNGNQGLFTSPAWTVPGSFTADVDSSFDVVLGVTQASPSNPPEVTGVPISGFNTATYQAPVNITVTTGSNTKGASYILGAVVPEPSSMGLLVLAGLAAARRRR